MNKNWFVRKGMLFFPASAIGWILAAVSFVYCIYIFLAIDSRSHSASDTLRPFILNVLMVFILYSLIALFTSRSKN
ncbi:MAG TPA: hypothetical protein VKD08_04440 [Ignavibacteriaceae bacterium]|nr:hypothetical protein [Ignavibacteriaceae bacterium]